MSPFRLVAPLLGGAFLALLPLAVRAQDGLDTNSPKHLHSRVFGIPFSLDYNDPKTRDIRQLKLYVSPNNGVSWELHATAAPNQRGFDVRVDRDGPYAFAMQTVYGNGDMAPATLDQLRADKFVVVDTERPNIILQPLPTTAANAGKVAVGVKWIVRDENLDPRSLRLEVRWAGTGQWVPISDQRIEAQGEDIRSLLPGQRMEYRLSARDKAGNIGEQVTVVGSNVGPGDATTVDGAERFNAFGTGRSVSRPKFFLVNKARLALEFQVREKGKSGIAAVELWVTRNRTDWKKAEQQQAQAPQSGDKATVIFDAPEDGLYGFSTVARSGANIAQAVPTARDEPQIWVEVDTKPPEAKLLDVRFALANDPRTLVVTWEAKDKNLDVQPIILQYCENANPIDEKEWKDVTPNAPLANTGKHVFPTPSISGFQFYLRMKVFDRATNQTVVKWDKPIVVDLVRPHVEITDASPAKP